MQSADFSRTINDQSARKRVVIENVYPSFDCGKYPVKLIMGEKRIFSADIFADGHDLLDANLTILDDRHEIQTIYPLPYMDNDNWQIEVEFNQLGRYHFYISAWIDELLTWHHHFIKKISAKVDIHNEILELIILFKRMEDNIPQPQKNELELLFNHLTSKTPDELMKILTIPFFHRLKKYYQPPYITHSIQYGIFVDRKKAEFSTWYELFPRSKHSKNSKGKLRDVIDHLPKLKNMGFDVLYFPPIHPIGKTAKKGKNNNTTASPDEPGSPWAIGSHEGGHTVIHPELGSLDDFKQLIAAANKMGIEIALDYALQCSPDHPFLKAHPEWFKVRADGSLQYAENPPKKYEDIYPFNFANDAWVSLWQACKDILLFWIDQGVKIFRVDNPHTKPFIFWQWLIDEIKSRYPDVIFLAEAFTRPKVMYQLAKLGFSQSYTYFIWKTSKGELSDYIKELTTFPVNLFFRGNFWTNTPDILHPFLKNGRSAFLIRLYLAATLSANYGLYGPAYEFCLNESITNDSEEYLHSEKYEIKDWSETPTSSIETEISEINAIRHKHKALQQNYISFHEISNPNILCFSKRSSASLILMIITLDPTNVQRAKFKLPFDYQQFKFNDLLNNTSVDWQSPEVDIVFDPKKMVAQIINIEPH